MNDYNDRLGSDQPKISLSARVDLCHLANAHRLINKMGGYFPNSKSELVDMIVEALSQSAVTNGHIEPVGNYQESLIYLESHGLSVRSNKKTKQQTIRSLARIEANKVKREYEIEEQVRELMESGAWKEGGSDERKAGAIAPKKPEGLDLADEDGSGSGSGE